MNKTETILVTGVAGFIGFHTAKKLLDSGYNVVGIDNLNDYYDVKLKNERLKFLGNPSPAERGRGEGFVFLKCDFSNQKQLFTKLKKHKFTKIIHLGAQAGVRYSIENPHAYENTNYLGTLNLLKIFSLTKKYKFITTVT